MSNDTEHDTITDTIHTIDTNALQADVGLPCYVSTFDTVLGEQYRTAREQYIRNTPSLHNRVRLVAEVQAQLFDNGEGAANTVQQQMIHMAYGCDNEALALDLLAVGTERI